MPAGGPLGREALRIAAPPDRGVPAGEPAESFPDVAGAAMSLVADEAMTPLAGFSAPNSAYPLVTHLRGFAAHLVFGLAVAATCELAWGLRRRRP